MSRSQSTFPLAAFLAIACSGVSACVSAPAALVRSGSLPVYGSQQIAKAPGIERVIGPVSGLVCNVRYDPAKGQADALKQLQARALEHGGDGVIGVQFSQVTNARSPCWHGVEATGLAVIYVR